MKLYKSSALQRAGRSTAAFLGAVALGLVFASAAAAQQASAPLVPAIVAMGSDDDSVGDASALAVNGAFSPLKLSLTGGLFSQASTLPGCASREDASGNSVNGFALQRYSYIRLSPRLILHGFATDGCAVDAGLSSAL